MNVRLQVVNMNQKHVLRNLLEFYIYEFSSYLELDFNQDGLFGFDRLDNILTEKEYIPYFIMFEDKLAGFVIVKEVPSDDIGTTGYSINEFFVAKKFMGKGIGKQAANMVFDLHQGKWTITQIEKNYAAQAFWRSTVNEYTNGSYKEYYDKNRRPVQEFDHQNIT